MRQNKIRFKQGILFLLLLPVVCTVITEIQKFWLAFAPNHAGMLAKVGISAAFAHNTGAAFGLFGGKAFLLGQGFMPAQQFHILKNPLHEEDPWYYVDEISYPLQTAEFTFEKGSLKRPEYIQEEIQ